MYVYVSQRCFGMLGKEKLAILFYLAYWKNIDLSNIYSEGRYQCGSLVMEVWHGKGEKEKLLIPIDY